MKRIILKRTKVLKRIKMTRVNCVVKFKGVEKNLYYVSTTKFKRTPHRMSHVAAMHLKSELEILYNKNFYIDTV